MVSRIIKVKWLPHDQATLLTRNSTIGELYDQLKASVENAHVETPLLVQV